MTIARVWHGAVPKAKSAEYLEYVKKTGMRDYARTPGNQGATIWMREDRKKAEFLVVSYWKSMGAIKKFAGEDTEKARYYPKDADFFLEFEPRVKHYNIAFEVANRETRRT